jgi:hypothetical protein
MSNIRLTADRGAVVRVGGVIYERRPLQPTLGIPNAEFTGEDASDIQSMTFNYDDLGVENGPAHRTWTAQEMAVSHYLAANFEQVEVPATTHMYGQPGLEVWTAPSDGIVRAGSYHGNGNFRAQLSGVTVFQPNGYAGVPGAIGSAAAANPFVPNINESAFRVMAGQPLVVWWNSPNYSCHFTLCFLPDIWPIP